MCLMMAAAWTFILEHASLLLQFRTLTFCLIIKYYLTLRKTADVCLTSRKQLLWIAWTFLRKFPRSHLIIFLVQRQEATSAEPFTCCCFCHGGTEPWKNRTDRCCRSRYLCILNSGAAVCFLLMAWIPCCMMGGGSLWKGNLSVFTLLD